MPASGSPYPARRTFVWLSARRLVTAQTLSLDVRLGPPGLGSLRVRFAFAIHGCARSHSPLEGMGSPDPPQLRGGGEGLPLPLSRRI